MAFNKEESLNGEATGFIYRLIAHPQRSDAQQEGMSFVRNLGPGTKPNPHHDTRRPHP